MLFSLGPGVATTEIHELLMAAVVAPSRSLSQESASESEELSMLIAASEMSETTAAPRLGGVASSPQTSSTPKVSDVGSAAAMPQDSQKATVSDESPRGRNSVVGSCEVGALLGNGSEDITYRDAFFRDIIDEGTAMLRAATHVKARESPYPRSEIQRYSVADAEVPWAANILGDYEPVHYTAPSVKRGPVWADPMDPQNIGFNAYDPEYKVDRTSHEGEYLVDAESNLPMNPRGRTGILSRGLLGRYGPNHAADPVVTRWLRDDSNDLILDDAGIPQMEFVAIKRKDTGEWAIPGGMVDPGENISATLKREFGEETMASLELPEEQLQQLRADVDRVFKDGTLVYCGYVDDHRNTDCAWMETTCVNFHDESGRITKHFKLTAGDDAGDVAWTRFYEGMPLYATHTLFLSLINKLRLAWYHEQQRLRKEKKS